MTPRDSPKPAPPGQRLLILLLVLVGLGLIAWNVRRTAKARGQGSSASSPRAVISPEIAREIASIEDREREADRTTWAPELLAQEHGLIIEQLWDTLNTASNALALLREVPLRSIAAPANLALQVLPHGIHRWKGTGAGPVLSPADWRLQLDARTSEGWHLDQSEWRHRRFRPATSEIRAASWFEVTLHLSHSNPPTRAQISATVRFEWPRSPPDRELPIDLGDAVVEDLEITARDGDPAFRLSALVEVAPYAKTTWIDPLILRDSKADAGRELLLAGRNIILRRGIDGLWKDAPLSASHPGLIFTALHADFTGDGVEDLLLATRSGLVLLRGGASGEFDTPGELVWKAPERLQYAQAMTCGDIDGDGDLDVFLGQYRTPYESGQMPHPYFDANDGPPAYLLRNVGEGRFEDATSGSGLEAKRNRRTYAASFVDLDANGDLDLVVTSDFAGVDVYSNDGHGKFSLRTSPWIDDPLAFGMSHAFADFDDDGRIDLLLLGMPQNTVDRLEALGLERPGHEADAAERSRLTFGNRLYFGGPSGFRQRPVGRQIARTGWAWSSVACDLDNDRFPDLHIVNGHDNRQFVHDFEPEFWLHDIYVGSSKTNPAVDAYFSSKFARARAEGWSYGGYFKNRLFLNQAGAEFIEVGHLFGVALEEASRNVLADDLDGDGNLDLVVTTFETWPIPRQTVRIFQNTLTQLGHWIAFRLRPTPGGIAPAGAAIKILDRQGPQTQVYVTGDGYRSEAAPRIRFGLGDVTLVDTIEVRWPGGQSTRLAHLEADRIYDVPCPPRPAPR